MVLTTAVKLPPERVFCEQQGHGRMRVEGGVMGTNLSSYKLLVIAGKTVDGIGCISSGVGQPQWHPNQVHAPQETAVSCLWSRFRFDSGLLLAESIFSGRIIVWVMLLLSPFS